MRPMQRNEDGTFQFYKDCDPVKTAFTWVGVKDKKHRGFKAIATFESTHSYGAPSLFKPSVQEVLDAAPQEYPEAVGFTLEVGGQGVPPDCFTPDQSRHRAIITVWAKADAKAPAITVKSEKCPATLGDLIDLGKTMSRWLADRRTPIFVDGMDLEMALLQALHQEKLIIYRLDSSEETV